jgi:hypothetical protein
MAALEGGPVIPAMFNEANFRFMAPDGLEESQVRTIPGFRGPIIGGSLDGEQMTVVAWKPDNQELARLMKGDPVFLSVLGGLPAHFLTTSFAEATNPA